MALTWHDNNSVLKLIEQEFNNEKKSRAMQRLKREVKDLKAWEDMSWLR